MSFGINCGDDTTVKVPFGALKAITYALWIIKVKLILKAFGINHVESYLNL